MKQVDGEPRDEQLVGLIARGDREAFAIIYGRYAKRMYAWAVARIGRDRAEDSVQELFLKLWRKADTFDPARGSFSTWFFSVARHQLIAEAQRLNTQQRVQVAAELQSALGEMVARDTSRLSATCSVVRPLAARTARSLPPMVSRRSSEFSSS